MIGRPTRSSMAIAWAFIATSTPPFATPSRARARVKIGRPGARMGNGVASKTARIATVVVARLPKRAVNAPLSGSPSNDPAAIAKRAKPRTLSLSERACLASGMWGIQLPSAAPLAKKIQDAERRERDTRSSVSLAASDIGPYLLPAGTLGAFQPPPGFKHTGRRPGLCRRAARRVWGIAVEDFADMPERGVRQMVGDRFEPRLGGR